MTQIAMIVKSVLEQHESKCLGSETERDVIAHDIAVNLTQASLQQLADLLGGSIEVDNDGQAVVYTGVQL